jgi:hypothetical protein
LGITVTFGLPQQCTDLHYTGCYYTGTKIAYVTEEKLGSKAIDNIIYHELGHACGYKNEKGAQRFADYWSYGVSRGEDYLNATVVCKLRLKKGDLPNKR